MITIKVVKRLQLIEEDLREDEEKSMEMRSLLSLLEFLADFDVPYPLISADYNGKISATWLFKKKDEEEARLTFYFHTNGEILFIDINGNPQQGILTKTKAYTMLSEKQPIKH